PSEPVVAELRLALHTGSAMAEARRSEERPRLVPLGDTLSLAERLLGHAGAGGILLSPAMARRGGGLFELRGGGRSGGPAPADRLAGYSVIGMPPGASALERRASEGLSVFVGRERELTVLREAFDAARGGTGQVVFVVGEAGLGKSRLLFEFRRQLADEPHL